MAWTKQYAVHSFNRYAYANNNPYKYVDPDGEFAFTAIAVASLAYAAYDGYQSGGASGALAEASGYNDAVESYNSIKSGDYSGAVLAAGAIVFKPLKAAKAVAKRGDPLKEALSKAKPTDGHPNQLMHELDDGTRVIFRKDFGDQAHAIGGPFQGKGKVDHYNIEVQRPNTRRPNKMKTIEDLHVVPNGKGSVTAFDINGKVK